MAESDRSTRVVKLAYELAQTGKFEDMAAIERELASVGLSEELRALDRPGIRAVINEACVTGREREEATWHSHTSA
jgi:hypothetical protein